MKFGQTDKWYTYKLEFVQENETIKFSEILKYKWTAKSRGIPWGVMGDGLDCSIVVSDFELQSYDYVQS